MAPFVDLLESGALCNLMDHIKSKRHLFVSMEFNIVSAPRHDATLIIIRGTRWWQWRLTSTWIVVDPQTGPMETAVTRK